MSNYDLKERLGELFSAPDGPSDGGIESPTTKSAVAGNGRDGDSRTASAVTEEALLAEALKIAQLANWEYDVVDDQFTFNDQFYALLRTTAKREGGYVMPSAHYAQRFVHPDDASVVGIEIRKAIETTDPNFSRQLDHRIIYADGEAGYFTFRFRIEKDTQGRTVKIYGANQDITQRKLAEQSLTEAQSRAQVILEAVTAPMVISRVSDGLILYANQQLSDLIRVPLGDLLNQQTPDFYHDAADRQAVVGLIRSQGNVLSYELRLQRGDGSLFWALLSAKLFTFQGGPSIITTLFDITERKRAEEALRTSQTQLSEVLKIAQLSNWEYDVANDLFTFNDHFYAIFHTSAEREGGYSMSSARYAERFVHPDDLAVVGVEIQKALESTDQHYSRRLDHRILYADGGIGYITVQIHIERDAQGRILRYYGANQDITDRKRAEVEGERLLVEMRQSEQMMRSVIDSTPDWIFVKDQQHRYVLANKGYADALHLKPEGFVGKNDLDLGFPEELVKGDPEKGIRGFWADDRLVMDSGETQVYPNDTATIDGEVHVFHTIKTPIRDIQGNITGVLAFARDITEREHLLAEVEKRAADLATVARIGNAATTLLNTQELLQSLADLTQQSFDLYHAHIYLLDEAGTTLTLAAGAGEVGRRMVEQEHGIPIDSEKSLVAKAARTRQGVIVNDVRQDPDFLPNPLLAETRAEMAIPLLVGDQVLGVLDVQSAQVGRFTAEDVNIQTVLASQIGAALHNSRLYEQTQSALQEVNALHRLMTREGWQTFRAGRGEAAPGYVFDRETVRPANPEDFEFHRAHADVANVITDHFPVSHAALVKALSVRDEPIGVLGLYDPDGQSLSEEEEALLGSLSVQVAQAMERARLLEQTQKRAVEIETVAQVSTVASTILDPDQLLTSVVNLTRQRFGLYHCQVYLLDEQSDLVLRAGAGQVGERMVAEGKRIPLASEQSLVAQAARARQAVIANDVQSTPDWLPNPLLPDTRSEMAVPLIIGDQILGIFDVQSDLMNAFAEEDTRIYGTLASQVAIALQNARLYAEQMATVTRLRELDHLKSSFLANMSHELRTPLNSILGFADVILEGLDGPLTGDMENDLKLIGRNGQHLLSLINDVLDMAKIEAGKMNLNVERFNLREVLEEVVDITSPLAREKSLALQLEDKSMDDLDLRADRIRLRQVMINLVGNAIKFTEAGHVTLQAAREDGHIQIRVKDTGIGVAPDQTRRIFDEFSQIDTSTTRKAGGTGLGLPISRRLIELHGGNLWVESTGVPGEGSTFIIELPVTSADGE